MKDKNLTEKIGYLIGLIVAFFIDGFIITFVYNKIALEFNLPNFGYWVCTCCYYVIKKLLGK